MSDLKNQRVLFLCAFLAACVWMSRTTFSAVAPVMKDELGLTYTQLGLPPMAGLAFAAAGYARSGFLAHRFGTRNVLLMSASSMIIGTVALRAQRPWACLFSFRA
ncbi:MAG: MFS transporter [Candidatus Bathyarchaeia archaeon]